MEASKFTALYNTLVTKGEDLVLNVGVVLAVLLFVISVLGLMLAAWLSHFVLGTLRTIIQHINAILTRDFRRYIEIPEYIPDEVKVMYDLLRFMKHITQYNSSKEAELHELIAVIKDLDDFKEVRNFLICCQRIALKCMKTQNYTESVKICTLFACTLDHPKKVKALKSDKKALKELIALLDLLAQSLLEARQLLEQAEIDRISKALADLEDWEIKDKQLGEHLRYLTWVIRNPEGEEEEASFIHRLRTNSIEEMRKRREQLEIAATESYRRVVFGTEYSTLMKGKTIENVISLAIHIVEKLAPKDMFGFMCYTDRADVSIPTGSLDQKLAYIRALELFNQPEGYADFYTGLIGGLEELKRKRQHATLQLHFKHNSPVQSESLVLVTTGQLLNVGKETEAVQALREYKGELMVVWLNSGKERCLEGFRRIQGTLEQWPLQDSKLYLMEIRDSDSAPDCQELYQLLGFS